MQSIANESNPKGSRWRGREQVTVSEFQGFRVFLGEGRDASTEDASSLRTGEVARPYTINFFYCFFYCKPLWVNLKAEF